MCVCGFELFADVIGCCSVAQGTATASSDKEAIKLIAKSCPLLAHIAQELFGAAGDASRLQHGHTLLAALSDCELLPPVHAL